MSKANHSEPDEQLVAAELTFRDGRFERGLGVRVGGDGRIAEVGPLERTADRRLDRRALLPGFVNAHSHAFQRGLRGRGETFPTDGGDFWTWRQAMYGLVASLDREGFYRLCLGAFREMLACGMTAVGEFHYLHHASPAAGGGDFAFDELVLAAAREAGIRISLLEACYLTNGIGRPLEGAQRRFACSAAELEERLDRLAEGLDPGTQSLGVVAHSIRAVPLDALGALRRLAAERDLVFHLHVEEQRQEVEQCLDAYGRRPMQVLLDELELGPRVTAVHCTHTEAGDLERYLATGANVCYCPLTEADLGDGIPGVPAELAAGGNVALGSDQNLRLSMCEEMRWLEYVQRLARERRGVLRPADGRVGRRLFEIATLGGARSLGIAAGALEAGRWADLVAIDLDHPSLAGATPETLLDAFVFGARDEVVREVCVGGRWVRS